MDVSQKSGQARSPHAFTILELLVAMAVLAILVVMLLGLVDNATKLWRVNENRADSYREARAAMSIISRDLKGAIAGGVTNYFRLDDPNMRPAGSVPPASNASQLFFLSALPKSAQWSTNTADNKSDVCQVGYFLGYGTTAVASNAPVNTMNLYRYFMPSDRTFATFGTSNPPFAGSSLTLAGADVELLARNIVSFEVRAYSTVTNILGKIVVTNYNQSTMPYLPDLVEITVKAVNRDTAKRIYSESEWTNTTSDVVRPNLQTFSTRIYLPNQ